MTTEKAKYLNKRKVLENHKMPHMRLNLDSKADKNLRIYMAKRNISSKAKAINEILKKIRD